MLAVILPPDIGWLGNNLLKDCTGKKNQSTLTLAVTVL